MVLEKYDAKNITIFKSNKLYSTLNILRINIDSLSIYNILIHGEKHFSHNS
jgi:hypothetical protein